MHFNKLRVGAFRGLGNLDLAFTNVTLISGDTGTGKTSLLEAAGLALRPTDPGQWVSTALRRDPGRRDLARHDPGMGVIDGIIAMFSLGLATGQPVAAIKLGLQSGATQRQVTVVAKGYQGGDTSNLQLNVDVDGEQVLLPFPTLDGQSFVSPTINSVFVHTLGATPQPKNILDGVRWLGRQPPAIQACAQRLLTCVDATIQDVRLQGGTAQLHQRGRWVDLMMVGDGLRRALSLALTVARCSRGVLLIDGLENGLYHSRLAKFTNTLISVAETLQIQLVIGTDSLEVIDAALDAEDVTLHWLQRANNRVQAQTYDHAKLAALRTSGFDVR